MSVVFAILKQHGACPRLAGAPQIGPGIIPDMQKLPGTDLKFLDDHFKETGMLGAASFVGNKKNSPLGPELISLQKLLNEFGRKIHVAGIKNLQVYLCLLQELSPPGNRETLLPLHL